MTEHRLVCTICGAAFSARRQDARFCSAACRTKASRERRGLATRTVEALPEGHRRCGLCRQVKHVNDFYWLNGQRKRYQSYCKPCQRQAQRTATRSARGLPPDAPLKPGIEAPEGATYTHRGYVLEKRTGHHRANRHGWVYQHILVAEEKYRIPIPRSFTIHHRNRISDDNRPDNLELRVGPHGKGGDLMDALLVDPDVRHQAISALERYGYTVHSPA